MSRDFANTAHMFHVKLEDCTALGVRKVGQTTPFFCRGRRVIAPSQSLFHVKHFNPTVNFPTEGCGSEQMTSLLSGKRSGIARPIRASPRTLSGRPYRRLGPDSRQEIPPDLELDGARVDSEIDTGDERVTPQLDAGGR